MSSMSPVRVGTPLQAAAPRTHGRSLLPLSWGGACARPRRISKAPRRRSLEALEGVHPTRHHQRRLLTCPGVVSCCRSGAGLTARKKASCAPATSSSVQASDPRPPEPPGGQDLSARRRAVLAARQEVTPGTPRDPRVPREAARHPQGRSPGSRPVLTGRTHAPGVSTNPTAKPEATEGRVHGAPPPLRHCDARPRPGHLAGRPPAGAPTYTTCTGGQAAPRGQRQSHTPWRHPETTTAPAEPASIPGCSRRALCTLAPPPCPWGPHGSRRWPGQVGVDPWALEGLPAPVCDPRQGSRLRKLGQQWPLGPE